jgi:hypothetical protein
MDTSNLSHQPGVDYGVIIWPDAGAVLAKNSNSTSKRIYFAMSTYNPYHVILMDTTITRTDFG